ncbi:MAG: response regulator [Flavobacteriaceae bacterium]|nr:response regulator [Flavobacteriaceae bacterium]
MLETIKKKSIQDKIQFISISRSGIIKESENNLFEFEPGTSIFKVHPIFEAIHYYFNLDAGRKYKLSCINLEIGEVKGIYDIDIHLLEDQLIMCILDFTSHYEVSNTISQEKNESLIQAQVLREREEFKNRFLANTSHELRTPLSTIMGFTSILQKSELSLDQMHNLNVIKSSCEHLKNIIDDILDISSIEMGQLKIENNRFDLQNLFSHIESTYRDRSASSGVAFSAKIEDGIPRFIIGDKFRLNQVLVNLLNNAFNYTDSGEIELKATNCSMDEDVACIDFEIRDTGIGIDKKDLPAIFDSFTQFSSNRPWQGTGLGLSIVKNLIRLMGGKIEVSSELGKGTTFHVKLKFLKSQDQKVESTIANIMGHLNGNSEKRSILIAEDLEENQLLLMRILVDNKFHFDIANDGDQVIERLHQNKYDLILMDLKMPKMDGYDTTRFIRESSVAQFKDIPIIAVTAHVSTREREKCLERGMNDYIGKPFGENELISKINALLH